MFLRPAGRLIGRLVSIPDHIKGRPLASLGGGEWAVPQLSSLLRATVAGNAEIEAYEFDLKREGQAVRRLIVNAQKLVYRDQDHAKLLVALVDVTEARSNEKLKDDLLREKAILLQELQHRVANSLQIIASVLMQSAKRVQSDETRSHLCSAHNRVMSVASVQKQLAASRFGSVNLRSYLTDLCESLGASMIHDPEQIKLVVDSDDVSTNADISLSLGLIVTELVINALKHAFPSQRKGQITVSYRCENPDWTLKVADTGIGIATDPESAKPGLGTVIVEALAKQGGARVVLSDGHPGTVVSIVYIASQGNAESVSAGGAV